MPLIGADPEFTLIQNNTKFSAENIIPKLNNRNTKWGKIALDGYSHTAELNPTPEDTPRKFTENIHKLITIINKQLPGITLSTSNEYGWVGGHVHFDLPTIYPNQRKISQTLSYYWLLPLMSENSLLNLQRQAHGYGKQDKYDDRIGEHNPPTYEFRLPTADWLTYPKLTEATIAYLMTIWYDIINRKRTCSTPFIYKNLAQTNTLYQLILSRYKPIMDTVLQNINKNIKHFKLYPKYKKEIEYLFNYQEILKTKNKLNYDMAEGWSDETLWFGEKPKTTINLKPNTQGLAQTITLFFNRDYNMNKLKDTITSYITENTILLQTPIAFYGLKKGISQYLITNYEGIIEGEEIINKEYPLEHIREITYKMLNNSKQNAIAIGVPYEDRNNHQYSALIQKLKDITNKNITVKNFNEYIKEKTPCVE